MGDALCDAVGEVCGEAATPNRAAATPCCGEDGDSETEHRRIAVLLEEELTPRCELSDMIRQSVNDFSESRPDSGAMQDVMSRVVRIAAKRAREDERRLASGFEPRRGHVAIYVYAEEIPTLQLGESAGEAVEPP